MQYYYKIFGRLERTTSFIEKINEAGAMIVSVGYDRGGFPMTMIYKSDHEIITRSEEDDTEN